MALGADKDPTYQLYRAVIDAFGKDGEDVEDATAMGGFVADGLAPDLARRVRRHLDACRLLQRVAPGRARRRRPAHYLHEGRLDGHPAVGGRWTKRDSETGRFMNGKADGEPSMTVRKER